MVVGNKEKGTRWNPSPDGQVGLDKLGARWKLTGQSIHKSWTPKLGPELLQWFSFGLWIFKRRSQPSQPAYTLEVCCFHLEIHTVGGFWSIYFQLHASIQLSRHIARMLGRSGLFVKAQEKGVGIVEIELAHILVRYPALGLALWRTWECSSAVAPSQQPRTQPCLVVLPNNLPNNIDWHLIVRQLAAVSLYKQAEVFTPQIPSIAPCAIPLRHGSSSGARKTLEYHDSKLAGQSHASTRVVLNSRKS